MAYTKTEMSNRCYGAEDNLVDAQYRIQELEAALRLWVAYMDNDQATLESGLETEASYATSKALRL
jgi:hypothetical protein